MTQKYSRAQRRADYARIKEKRQFHWGYGHKQNWRNWGKTDNRGVIEFMPPDVAGRIARTATPCSCYMCGNPRRNTWAEHELTKQELKALDNFNDQMDYWTDYECYDWKYDEAYDYMDYCDWLDMQHDEEYVNWIWAKARGWIE